MHSPEPLNGFLLHKVGSENFTKMVGTFGSGGTTFQNRHLIGDAPRLPFKAIPRFGQSVVLEWETPAAALSVKLTRTAAGLVIETGGTSVRVELRSWPMPRGRGGLHGVRLRMTCPRCGASRDALHWAGGGAEAGSEWGWGCRGKDCLNLSHPSRHQQRWCPAIRRRAKLLCALVRCPHGSLKARAIRAQIRRAERAMIVNLERTNRDLTRRKQRHGRQRRTSSSERA